MLQSRRSLRWTRRRALHLMLGAIAGGSLHACAQNAKTDSATPAVSAATLGIVTWTGYAPLYIAQAKGFYPEAGLDLKLQTFNSNGEAIAAFTAGRVDGVSVVSSEAVTIAAAGKDYRVVYVVDTSSGGDGILARRSIGSIADFKGKQIAVEIGSVSHFLLLEVLSEAGLQERDVTLVNLASAAAAAAYQAGKIDIAVTYAPFLFTADAAQPDGRIIFDSAQLELPTAIADLILFNTPFAEQNSQAIEAFIRGSLKGLEFLQTNRAEGLAIAAEPLGVSPAELDAQLKGVTLADLAANVQMLSEPDSNLYLLKPMTSLAAFLKDQGQLDVVPDLSQILEPKFVLSIQPT